MSGLESGSPFTSRLSLQCINHSQHDPDLTQGITCSMSSVVSTPNTTGTPVLSPALSTPFVAALTTAS